MIQDQQRTPETGTFTVPGVNALQPVAPVVSETANPPQVTHPPARLGWLVFWMSGTLIAFIVAAVSVRKLSSVLNAFEIMTIRSAGGLLILALMGAAYADLRNSVHASRMRLQTFRNVVHFGSQICWTLAIAALPFATVFALEFTIPAFVALLAILFLGERMTVERATALAVCFAGVLVILRPGLATFQPIVLIMVLGAFLFAAAAVSTKKLITTEATFSIMLWMNLMQLPMNLVGSEAWFFLKLDAGMALPVIGVAVAGLAVHYCLTNAFRYGDAMVVIPMDFLRVPLIALIGWAFYGERLDAVVFLGAALIVGGVLWNVRSEAKRRDELARSPAPIMQPAE